ncbi:arginine/serine-rich coiled-coil protein 2-like [Salvia splendens]|uniref:arginine/serine-rich coiled-coil protein 2-like n=1 Tax=Salvia splendens TaxID=180675 RepID=UPI001100744D|nr:arginine/serine-rich coiled-coil protein 2-like [Salvia splendens]
MDSNARESSDSAEFRKPSNDAANRKYRRRSPVGGSSSSDGSPRNRHSLSPAPSRKETARVDDKRKRDDDRNQSGRSDEPYKSSDWHSSRSHYRQDDRISRDRHVDNYDRGHAKSSYHSRDSRGNNNLDYSRSDKYHKSRDYANEADTCSHGKSDGLRSSNRDKDSYDRAGSGWRHAAIEERDWDRDRDRSREGRADHYGKTDNKKSFVDLKSDCSPAYEESRGLRNDSFARKDSSVCHVKEAAWRDGKQLDSESHANDEKRRDDGRGTYKEQVNRESKENSDDMSIKGTSEPCVTDSDIDAARIAAMKAAELVNKNLVGTGYMSTDQKKKLLWGNKKSSATEESTAHRWDTPMFGDRERQEKFNKLMGVKADAKVENQGDNPDMEKKREQLQMELEKQYTAGLRRRDGRTVGLGL